MITYCLGSARAKREYFLKAGDVVLLDNVEVLFCASRGGRNYFAIGDVPFASFTADEYIKYRRALIPDPAEFSASAALARLGINPSKRLGRLVPAEMRCVSLVEKTGGADTDKTIVVNLDGAKCTRRNVRALRRLIKVCPDAYVCVTDKRFIKRVKIKHAILSFGKKGGRRTSFYPARVLAEKLHAKKVAVM